MAQKVVSDAAKFPQDEGIGSITDGNETWDSAGLLMLLGQCAQSGSYVRSDSELDFASHSAANDTADVQPGVAYISLAGETVTLQSGTGGTDPPAYDTTLTTTTMPAIAVVLPTAVTVDLQDSTLSQVWLAYDTDGTGPGAAGSVYLRSDDTGMVSAPSHPNVELGSANPDDASADTLANRFSSITVNALTVGSGPQITEAPSGVVIKSQSPSSVAAAEFTSGIDDEHQTYALHVADFVPATDNAGLHLEVSTDGGQNWKTGATDYKQALDGIDEGGTAQSSTSTGRAQIVLGGSVGGAAGEGASADIFFSDPANGSVKQQFRIGVSYYESGNNDWTYLSGVGVYDTAEAIDAVRLKPSSGNISSAEISLLGVN